MAAITESELVAVFPRIKPISVKNSRLWRANARSIVVAELVDGQHFQKPFELRVPMRFHYP
jgi:hypothetical protein